MKTTEVVVSWEQHGISMVWVLKHDPSGDQGPAKVPSCCVSAETVVMQPPPGIRSSNSAIGSLILPGSLIRFKAWEKLIPELL